MPILSVSSCLVCEEELNNNNFLRCTTCMRLVHNTVECSGLNTSELASLKQRNSKLLYQCDKCSSFQVSANASNCYSALLEMFLALKKEINTLTQLINEKHTTSSLSTSREEWIAEINDRKKRENNVIIYNFPEPNEDSLEKNLLQDKTKINETLESLVEGSAEKIFKTFRLGKPTTNRVRPVKVIFKDSYIAGAVLSCKKRIPLQAGYSIGYDQTPIQRDFLKGLRQELEARKPKEPNLTIKYYNGLPKIVSSSKN